MFTYLNINSLVWLLIKKLMSHYCILWLTKNMLNSFFPAVAELMKKYFPKNFKLIRLFTIKTLGILSFQETCSSCECIEPCNKLFLHDSHYCYCKVPKQFNVLPPCFEVPKLWLCLPQKLKWPNISFCFINYTLSLILEFKINGALT